MKSLTIAAALALAGLVAPVAPAAAQDLTADVRTWTGQSLRVSQASFEVFYTIFPPQKDDGGQQATGGMEGLAASKTRIGGGDDRLRAAQVFGSLGSIGTLLDRGPEPMQGNKYVEHVTVYRGGVERRIPVASIASLTFRRGRVINSTLPPYVAPSHYRHAATIALVDGTRIEADYVNLGTAFLRGATAEGRVDMSWQDIESIRFSR